MAERFRSNQFERLAQGSKARADRIAALNPTNSTVDAQVSRNKTYERAGSLAIVTLTLALLASSVTVQANESNNLGDVNCDGDVGSVDAALVLQKTAGLIDTIACQDRGDVNGDNQLNVIDAALILQRDAGLIEYFPAKTPRSTETQTEAPTQTETPTQTPTPVPTLDISILSPDAKVLIEKCTSHNLTVMDLDGSDKVHIADDAQTWDWGPKPDLSPDGQRILVKEHFDNREFSSYWNLYTSSGNLIKEFEQGVQFISWIDNENIIYNKGFDGGIFTMNTQSGVETELITRRTGTLDDSGSFSPDGSKLIYAHHEWGSHYFVSLAASSDLPLLGEDRYNERFNPKIRMLDDGRSRHNQDIKFLWTPDGNKVVYFIDGRGDETPFGLIKVLDINSGNVIEITPETTGLRNIYGFKMDLSPDGNTIIFKGRDKSFGSGVYTIDINGNNLKLLIDQVLRAGPVLSEDGNFVLIDDSSDGITIYSSKDGSSSLMIPETESTCAKSLDWNA